MIQRDEEHGGEGSSETESSSRWIGVKEQRGSGEGDGGQGDADRAEAALSPEGSAVRYWRLKAVAKREIDRRHAGFGINLLPLFDGEAVEPAEGCEEEGQKQEDESGTGDGLRAGRGEADEDGSRGCGCEDQGDDEFLGKPVLDGVAVEVDQCEIGHDDAEDKDVGAAGGREHVKEDQPQKEEGSRSRCDESRGAMPDVEEMALAEARGVMAKSVKDTVGYVEKPGPGEEKSERVRRQGLAQGTCKAEGPEDGDGGGIEREQVPGVEGGESGLLE